jgi:hypothetical protein
MNNPSFFSRSISITLAIVFLTNSIGYAKEASIQNGTSNCGEWNIEGGNLAKDQRMEIEPQSTADENNCHGLFALSNKTDINIGDISLGGGYTLKLTTATTDADTEFLLENEPFPPFLFPGLDIDIKTIPHYIDHQATIDLQGNLSLSAFTIDLVYFLIKSSLTLAHVPCVIPTKQLAIIVVRLKPIIDKTNIARFALRGDFTGSYKELSKTLPVFQENLYAILRDTIVSCSIDALKPKILAPAQVKILWAYMTWLPVVIFDYLQYEGAPASFTFVYTPPTPVLSSEDWIAFKNKNNIWLIHPDGNGLTQITQNGDENPHVVQLKWSPDGRTLAYSLSSRGGSAIMLYDLETSTTRMLVNDDVGGDFDWSLTSQQVIYTTPSKPSDPWSDKGLWTVNLGDGKKRQAIPPPTNSGFWGPQWSSEGSHVLFDIPGFEPGGYGVANYWENYYSSP